jgi:hypothetical protein
MNYFIFTAIIIGWLLVGLGGLANCKKDRVNGEMIIFLSFVPFIPLLAKIFL